jgi:hypothetical protein
MLIQERMSGLETLGRRNDLCSPSYSWWWLAWVLY